jgi:hypothetical protein
MIIEYLPTKPKYRAFIQRILEFLEQVYKDKVLADLRFVAYSKSDPLDLHEVRDLPVPPRPYSHYSALTKRAVVAEHHNGYAVDVFETVVEEVTHHALWGSRNKERVIRALLKDMPRLETPARGLERVRKTDLANLNIYINEFYTKYIVHNYFTKLNDRPVTMPWAREALGHYISAYYKIARRREKGIVLDVLSVVYEEVVKNRNPLQNFRETIHAMFTEVIKRFPVEVYKSNPSRYEILYREQRIQELPL